MLQNKPNSKLSILTQNLFLAVRKIKLRWIFIALLLPFFAIFAAFGTAPDSIPNNLQFKSVTEEVTLPLPTAVNHDEVFWQIDQVRRDDTLATLFKRMNVRDEEAIKFLTLSPDAHAINAQLIPGHTVEIKTNADGKLLYLEYEVDNENILIAGLTPNGYQIAVQKLVLESHQILKSATIVDSLFGATDDAGIPDQIALQVAEIFSSEIDFIEDLRPGDKFKVIYEAFYNAGELMKTGNVLAVEFVTNGKKYQAIHFGKAEGKFAYYTPEGKNLHKSFLRSPLEFTRVSSSFNLGRFHPILHKFKAHKGVDLAAPRGTRIKASGDGVIDYMGYKGGYGNTIIIKHGSDISTVYGHLSGFVSGLREGMQVTQGDIIAYVGMTGLATGPHLHYEFLVGGEHRDPMTIALPASLPIDNNYRKEFDAKSLDYMAQIEMLNRSQIVAKD